MGNTKNSNIKVGEFLVQNGLVTDDQITEALEMQKDNPERLIGEILVTMGLLTKDDLIMSLEAYLMVTGKQPEHVDEWLDQEEIDMLLNKLKEKENKKY